MLGDISWTGWSSIPKVDIVRTSGILSGATVQTLDTTSATPGAMPWGELPPERHGQAQVRRGLRPDSGADDQHRLVSLPDNNRTWFSAGAQIKVQGFGADLGAAYLNVPESKVDNNQTPWGVAG
jgi:long-chain fatty acid transport protein